MTVLLSGLHSTDARKWAEKRSLPRCHHLGSGSRLAQKAHIYNQYFGHFIPVIAASFLINATYSPHFDVDYRLSFV
jgi:hypothetical protein